MSIPTALQRADKGAAIRKAVEALSELLKEASEENYDVVLELRGAQGNQVTARCSRLSVHRLTYSEDL